MRRELSNSEKELFLSACLTYNSVSVDIPLALSNVSARYKNVTLAHWLGEVYRGECVILYCNVDWVIY